MIGPKQEKPTKADERRAYEDVTTRDEGRCVRCLYAGEEMHRDHRQNRQAGNTVVSNLQLLCGPHFEGGQVVPGCHHWKTHNPRQAVADGFSVPRNERPGFWPGWREEIRSWVIYLDKRDSRGRWWDPITESVAEMLMRGNES